MQPNEHIEQLGYLRRRRRGSLKGDTPKAPPRSRKRRWLSIGVVLVVLCAVAFCATALARQRDRDTLIRDAAGTWAQSGATGSILVITRPPVGSAVAGGARFRGTIGGGVVHGVVSAPSFPSLGRTLQLSLFGQPWVLQLQSRHVLTLTSSGGSVITFRGPA
jgi:hypothetical protein